MPWLTSAEFNQLLRELQEIKKMSSSASQNSALLVQAVADLTAAFNNLKLAVTAGLADFSAQLTAVASGLCDVLVDADIF